MAWIGLFLAVVVNSALDVLLPEGLPILPDLALMTALYVGFRARNSRDLGYAIGLGLMADCFSACPLGHFAFLYGSAAYLALQVRRYVPPDAYVSHVVALLFCTLFTAGLEFLIALVTVDGRLAAGFLRSLLEAVSSAAVAPFLFAFWDKSRFFRRALGGRRYEFVR